MYAEFSENLITGNEMIDSQHKELIEKMNQLLESCENGNDKLTAVKTLDYLEDYTDYHFKAEEQLQRDIDYPGYESLWQKSLPSSGGMIFHSSFSTLAGSLIPSTSPMRFTRRIQ